MKVNSKAGCLVAVLLLVLLSVGDLWAQSAYEREPDPEPEPLSAPYRFSVSGKMTYHTFWKQGLLDNGEAYGRPGLGVNDLAGIGGEVDFDYHWRPFMVFSATLGAYQGKTDQYHIEVFTGYALATAKLQKITRIVDYYLGAGLGAYFSRMKAEGTSNALQPGLHGLIGMRFHVTPKWSILLEDRLALTLRAEDGFGDLDLGGNFVMLGGSYHFHPN